MKVINQSEGDRIRYAVVDDDGATLNWFGSKARFIAADPHRIIEAQAEAWRDGYVSGLNDQGYDAEHWRAEAERWRMVADNAASDHVQADTDSLRALQERNELRKRVEELEASMRKLYQDDHLSSQAYRIIERVVPSLPCVQ